MNANRSERGQALVLIILSIVAIFGFAALAVDMGRIYSERRRAQSAADAAALSAAYSVADYRLQDQAVIQDLLEQAALASVAENGFLDPNPNVEGDIPDVYVSSPPDHGDYEECDCQYIQVRITTKMDPIFAQFVFKGEEKVTSEAVARGRRNTWLSEDNAIHALSTDADAVEFDGNTQVEVKTGSIYSNGGLLKNGTPGVVRVADGKFKMAQDFQCNPGTCANVKGVMLKGQEVINLLEVPAPYCPTANETINGVNYYVHNGISSSTTLPKGIHCVNGDIRLTGNDTLKGDGVLIVMQNGTIDIKGNAKVNLKRASKLVDKYGHSFNGMLIFAPKDNMNDMSINGTSGSWFSGTIFAPGSTCNIGGTSGTNALHTSIICDKVKFHGTSKVTIIYKNNENYQMQPLVELVE